MVLQQFMSWTPLLIYLFAALPQLIKSWRGHSAVGVSQWMVFIRMGAVGLYTVYVFMLGLPMAYRVMMPCFVISLGTIAWQGYHYEKRRKVQERMLLGYSLIAMMILVGIAIGQWWPQWVGTTYGKMAAFLYIICEIPQAYRNYARKSVAGFSFGFASMMGAGALLEITNTLMFGLPLPTLLSSGRIFFFYLIYCVQFMIYPRR